MTALMPKGGTTLVLVRHGQSTFNAWRRFQGCSDEAELTALGRLTAASCGEKLSAIPFDAIIVSPLQRARQTADEIARVFRIKAGRTPETQCEALLREIHVPQWEGLSFDEIRTRFPEQFRVWESAPHLLEVPAGRYGAPARKTFHPVARLFEQARLFIHMVRVLHGGPQFGGTHLGHFPTHGGNQIVWIWHVFCPFTVQLTFRSRRLQREDCCFSISSRFALNSFPCVHSGRVSAFATRYPTAHSNWSSSTAPERSQSGFIWSDGAW